MKLNVGDVIQVHGWVMLEKLNDGEKFKVDKISKVGFDNIYWFTKPQGTKIIIGHKVTSVDLSINTKSGNWIEVL